MNPKSSHSYRFSVVGLLRFRNFDHFQSHPSNLMCVSVRLLVKTSGHAISVSYGFDLKNDRKMKNDDILLSKFSNLLAFAYRLLLIAYKPEKFILCFFFVFFFF